MNIKIAVIVASALVSTAVVSNALSIAPNSTFLINTGTDGNAPDSNNAANPENAIFAVYGLPIVYKDNVGGLEEGAFENSYTTTYNGDTSGGTIKWDAGPSLFGFSAIHLLVKDGNHQPYWYLFDLTAANWNGTEDLSLSGFWPSNGAISHVTLFAAQGPSSSERVPDGGTTLATLGFALLGLGSIRKMLGTKA